MCDKCKQCMPQQEVLPPITSAFLVLTERCNLACVYCWVNQNPKNMSFETAKKSVDFLIDNAEKTNVVPNITFFGGEPLLRWDDIIVPITRYIREDYKKPFTLNITSNCVLMTEDKMKFLSENEVTLLFSIDGDKATQDYNRPTHGTGSSFDKLEKAIDLIPTYFPKTTFRSTIIPETVEHTFENIKFGLNKGYPHVYAAPNVFIEWSEKEKQLLREEMRKISDYYMDNLREGRIVNYINLDEKIRDVIEINRVVKGLKKRNTFKCGLGVSQSCSISPSGVLLGCQEMSSYEDETFVIGDIYKGANDEKRRSLAQQFHTQHIEGENCDTCSYRPICSGGCVANNYLINKNLNKVPKMSCFWNQMMIEEATRVINMMGREKNQLFLGRHFTGWEEV